LWAIESAARCPAVAAVIADGSGLVMAHTRRLQLAAEAGSALLLLARPPRELDRLSAAATRWLVSCAPSTSKAPTWNVQLLRCKGLQLGSEVLRHDDGCERRWTMEWNRAQGGVAIHASLVGRSAPAAQPRPASIRRSA
jgi:protein ImuA